MDRKRFITTMVDMLMSTSDVEETTAIKIATDTRDANNVMTEVSKQFVNALVEYMEALENDLTDEEKEVSAKPVSAIVLSQICGAIMPMLVLLKDVAKHLGMDEDALEALLKSLPMMACDEEPFPFQKDE